MSWKGPNLKPVSSGSQTALEPARATVLYRNVLLNRGTYSVSGSQVVCTLVVPSHHIPVDVGRPCNLTGSGWVKMQGTKARQVTDGDGVVGTCPAHPSVASKTSHPVRPIISVVTPRRIRNAPDTGTGQASRGLVDTARRATWQAWRGCLDSFQVTGCDPLVLAPRARSQTDSS